MPTLSDLVRALKLPYGFTTTNNQPVALAEKIRAAQEAFTGSGNSVEDYLSIMAQYRGNWAADTEYAAGTFVNYGTELYFIPSAITSNAASTPRRAPASYVHLNNYLGPHDTLAVYLPGAMVEEDNQIWFCTSRSTSANDAPPDDAARWSRISWNQSEIEALVSDWALASNTDILPLAKLPASLERIPPAATVSDSGKFYRVDDQGDGAWQTTTYPTEEFIRDVIGRTIIAGDNYISINVDDPADQIRIGFTPYRNPSDTNLSWEEIMDSVGNGFLVGGNNVTLDYDDAANTLTINAENTQRSIESIQDIIGGLVVAGDGIQVDYYDSQNRLVITNTASGGGGGLTEEQARDTIAAFIQAGANISIDHNDENNTFTISAQNDNTQRTDEEIRDLVASFLTAGSNVTLVHDDAGNTLTINSTGSGGGGLDAEQVRDAIASFLVAGSNISITHDDAGNTLTIAETTARRTDEEIRDFIAGFIQAGTNITVDHDDAGNSLTINSTAGSGGSVTSRTDEQIRDVIANFVVGGANVTVDHDDAANTLTIASTDTDTNTQRTDEEIRDLIAGFIVGGTNVTVTHNDAGNELRIESIDTNTQRTDEQIRDVIANFITAGTNITAVHDDDNNTLTIASTASGGGGLTLEQVRDEIASFIQAGSNVSIVHDDPNDTLTITSIDTDTNTQRTDEEIRDLVANFITGGTNVTVQHDDDANTLTITSTAGSTGGATTILQLNDTPSSFSGQARMQLSVNDAETAFEFTAPSPDVSDWALEGNAGVIPADKIAASITRDTELDIAIADFKTEAEIVNIVDRETHAWAQDGNTEIIPAEKLPVAVQQPGTDITISRTATQVQVRSSTGANGNIAGASGSNAGMLTADLWSKLNAYPNRNAGSGGQLIARRTTGEGYELINAPVALTLEQIQDAVAAMLTTGDNIALAYNDAAGTLTVSATIPAAPAATPTNLSINIRADGADVVSSTGTNATLNLATSMLAGLFAPAEKTKLGNLSENRQLPSGGSNNQVLAKSADTDYAVHWINPATPLTLEQVRDEVASFIQGGTLASITHDDDNDLLTLDVSVSWADVSGKPTVLSREQVRDVIANFVVAGDNVEITHDDSANTLTVDAGNPDWRNISGTPWNLVEGQLLGSGFFTIVPYQNRLLEWVIDGTTHRFTIPSSGRVKLYINHPGIREVREFACQMLRQATQSAPTGYIFATQGNPHVRFWTDNQNRLGIYQSVQNAFSNCYIELRWFDDGFWPQNPNSSDPDTWVRASEV